MKLPKSRIILENFGFLLDGRNGFYPTRVRFNVLEDMRAHVTYVAYDTRLGTKSCGTKIIEIDGITGNRSFSLFRTAKGFNLCKHARCVYPPTQVGSIFSKFRALTFRPTGLLNISSPRFIV